MLHQRAADAQARRGRDDLAAAARERADHARELHQTAFAEIRQTQGQSRVAPRRQVMREPDPTQADRPRHRRFEPVTVRCRLRGGAFRR